jgi:hypothetical protein
MNPNNIEVTVNHNGKEAYLKVAYGEEDDLDELLNGLVYKIKLNVL